MKVFNVGLSELVLVALLALIVLGPDRIVQSARTLGIWLRKLTKSPLWNDVVATSNEIRDFPRKVMEETGLDESLSEINESTRTIGQQKFESKSQLDPDIQNHEDTNENKISPHDHFDKA